LTNLAEIVEMEERLKGLKGEMAAWL